MIDAYTLKLRQAMPLKDKIRFTERRIYEWVEHFGVNGCYMNGMKSKEDKPRLYAKMKSIRIINGSITDLKIDTPVYEIEFELIKEQTNEK